VGIDVLPVVYLGEFQWGTYVRGGDKFCCGPIVEIGVMVMKFFGSPRNARIRTSWAWAVEENVPSKSR